MACGTPIVTSRANGLEELAGPAALLVNPKDPDEIAAAVRQILSDPSVKARLMAAGLERSRIFSWDACARRTLEILTEVGAGVSATAAVSGRSA